MSQQEFVPQSQQGSQAGRNDNIHTLYYWPTKSKTGAMPKTDHPSSYEEPIPPYNYQAQDRGYEQGATRSYNSMQQPQWQQVPPWARPQRQNKGVLRWIVLIVLGLLLIKPLLILATIILAGTGIVLLIVLLPILLSFGILLALAVTVLIVLAALGMPLRFGRLRPWNRR